MKHLTDACPTNRDRGRTLRANNIDLGRELGLTAYIFWSLWGIGTFSPSWLTRRLSSPTQVGFRKRPAFWGFTVSHCGTTSSGLLQSNAAQTVSLGRIMSGLWPRPAEFWDGKTTSEFCIFCSNIMKRSNETLKASYNKSSFLLLIQT
jgi:hypothetical protein